MHATLVKLALAASAFFLLGAAQLSSDVCGEITGVLKFPSPKPPHKEVIYGTINECICLSHIPGYIGSNSITVRAGIDVGKSAVTASIMQMFNGCEKQTCHYPPYSVPACIHGNPCSFTCSDGYLPFPQYRPTQCVCNKPYTVCNGKCGLFKACPSGRPVYYKRGLENDRCPAGQTACPVPGRGRSVDSMECVNAQTDLESCGGCTLPAYPGQYAAGVDCTSIHGIADVSCIRGQCVVHRCMAGYTPNTLRDLCAKSEDASEIVLGKYN